MKALIIAFGHPDNVLSLCHYLSQQVDLTLVFVVSGLKFQQGVININLDGLENGLHADHATFERIFPEPIVHFVGGRYRIWIQRLPSLKLLNLNNLKLYQAAIAILKTEEFDVVHYNGFSPYIYLFYQQFRGKAAQFWTLHDYKSHSGEKKFRAEAINRILARLKSLTVIQHYNYLLEKVIEEFKLPSNKARTLFSGTLDVFHAFEACHILCPVDDYILFFGRISKYKGIETLLEAYSHIRTVKPKLVIAGKGDFWFDTSPYKADPQIIFLNHYIENESLLGLIQRSQFVVAPYHDATHSAVIATAYALNKPVVASDVDGLKEVVFDNLTGKLVSPGSAGELQEAMEGLFRYPSRLQTYAANIIKEKEMGKMSWGSIIKSYIALYSGS